MISQKIFTGKMNSDVSEYMLPAGDYLYAMNLRIGSSDGQDVGTVVNTKSNKVIPVPDSLQYLFDTAEGTVNIKTIGSGVAEDVRKVFWFVYRSDNRDFIMEYDSQSETISKILVNLDDTNNVDITKFSLTHPIFSINLIDGIYLKWTDFKSRPSSIDINRFKSGEYGVITDFHIRAAKAPSLTPPSAVYTSNPTVSSNRLKKKLFQIQYLYNYDSNERSVYSPMSTRPIPIDETTNDTDVTKNNGISVTFNIGTNQVKSIDVIARYGKNDWFLINTFNRTTVSQTDQFGAPADPGYDPINNTYTFTFYNDGNYNNVNLNEQLLYFDYMPILARTQEYAQGSMLYAGVAEGRDPVSVSGIVYPSYSSAAYVDGTSIYAWKSNSKYKFGIIYFDQFGIAGTVNTVEAFNVSTKSFGDANGANRIAMNWNITHTPPAWAVEYQWARTENLTHQNFLFWRVRVATAIGQNNKQYYDLFVDTIESFNRANQGSATTVDRNQRSTISYGYTAGDRVTVHRLGSDPSFVDDYDTEVVDFEVYTAPVLPATQSNVPLYRLRIAAKSTEPIVAGALIEIYTPKTPAPSGNDLNVFYEFGQVFDITNPGTDSAVHSVSSGIFTEGDVFYRARLIPNEAPVDDMTHVYTTDSEDVEDPNFSDFYISNFNSSGRPNIVDKNNKQIDLEATFRFTEPYLPDTQLNGLNRVFQLSSEDYDKAFGPIQRIELRGNQIETFQRLNTGAIPLFANITETATGSTSLILSEKLLNRIRYYFGGYGIGDQPTALVINDGLIFFTDPNRGEVLRLDGSGINSISKQAYMDNYFTSILTTYARGNQAINGGFEKRFSEYILSFANDDVNIFDFDDPAGSQWDNSHVNTLNRSSIAITTGPSIGSASMLGNGILRYTPTLTEIGEAVIVYTGNDLLGNSLGNRNLCINVTHDSTATKWVGINPKCFTIMSVTKKYYLNRQLYLADGSAPYTLCDGQIVTQENYNPSDDAGSRANPDYVSEVTDDCFCLNECEDFSGNVNFINNTLYTFFINESTSHPVALGPSSSHEILFEREFHTIRSTNSGSTAIKVYQYDCATVDPLTVTPKFTINNTVGTYYLPVADGNTVFLGFIGDPIPTC